eukprot:TRINITY_DN9652_c0_g1_i1.p2 TRINITY_DN9652_c0_g1~~TRINITY_DN9652_c0_g1_i1.p2  ORF type:complete len:115 (-),score=0.64 TRINITY_DN9652_c0_g1_i1:12-356(-)
MAATRVSVMSWNCNSMALVTADATCSTKLSGTSCGLLLMVDTESKSLLSRRFVKANRSLASLGALVKEYRFTSVSALLEYRECRFKSVSALLSDIGIALVSIDLSIGVDLDGQD